MSRLAAADVAGLLEARDYRTRQRGDHVRARCLICDGRDLSVWIKDGDYGPPLIHCHRCGCSRDEFCAALGLPRDALAPPKLVQLPPVKGCSPASGSGPPKYLGVTNSLNVVLPKRTGCVARALVADLAQLLGQRRAAGDYRAQPYAAAWAAQRIGKPERNTKRALHWLIERGVLVPRPLYREERGRSATLAYRFNPSVLREEAGAPTFPRPLEAPRRVAEPGRREPVAEGHHDGGVPVAELAGPLVGIEVQQRRLGAVECRTGRELVGHAVDLPTDSGRYGPPGAANPFRRALAPDPRSAPLQRAGNRVPDDAARRAVSAIGGSA